MVEEWGLRIRYMGDRVSGQLPLVWGSTGNDALCLCTRTQKDPWAKSIQRRHRAAAMENCL